MILILRVCLNDLIFIVLYFDIVGMPLFCHVNFKFNHTLHNLILFKEINISFRSL